MNCSDFEMNVRALVRAELMDAGRREGILGHATNCLQCSDRLAGEQALIAGVRAVVAELGQQKAPDRVGNALLAAFREHASAVAGNNVVPMPVKVARRWRLEAVAAVILFVVSMGAVFWISFRSPAEKETALIESTPPVKGEEHSTAPTPHSTKPDAEISDDVKTERPIRSRSRAARHRTRATEEVTEFFPLMEGIDLDSLEAVQSVRVELPASALNDLGFQTGSEMTTGPVKADVLLGIDGLARAIRFVR